MYRWTLLGRSLQGHEAQSSRAKYSGAESQSVDDLKVASVCYLGGRGDEEIKVAQGLVWV